MRPLWTLLKVVLVLALIIPVSIIALVLSLGILGTLFGLAVFTLRIAILGLLIYGGFRFVGWLLRDKTPRPEVREIPQLPKVDPHYEAAMRELDRELGASR